MAIPKAVPALPLELVLKLIDSHCIIREDLKQRLRSEAKPMRGNGFTLVAGVEGGIVQGFSVKSTDDPDDLSIVVCDYDCEGSDDDEVIEFEDGDNTSRAWAYELNGDRSEPAEAFVQSVLDAMDERDSRAMGDDVEGPSCPAEVDG